MWKAFIHEIKHSILSSPWHVIKYLGILLIPLIYGFMYIFAFFNPFLGSGSLDIAIVSTKNDPYATAFINALNTKKENVKIGDLNLKLHVNHIYSTQSEISNGQWRYEEAKKHYASIFIKPSEQIKKDTTLTKSLADTMYVNRNILENPKTDITQKFNALLKQISSLQIFEFYTNYQKNYIIGMGIDLSSSMEPIYKKVVSAMFTSDMSSIWKLMGDPNFYNFYNLNKTQADKTIGDYQQFWKDMNSDRNHPGESQLDLLLNGVQTVNVHSQMGEHAEYGFGLAPFFISLAMWIGAMGLTLAINGKIYKSKRPFSKIQTYMAKLFAIWISISIGAIILMSALATIGFTELGWSYWSLLLQSIISGILLSTIVFAIRVCVPNKAAGIIIILMLLVLQMSSSGGLFTPELQFLFFRIVNKILPFTYSVDALREMTYAINWLHWFIDISVMLIYAVASILLGFYLWNKRKNKEEKHLKANKLVKDV